MKHKKCPKCKKLALHEDSFCHACMEPFEIKQDPGPGYMGN